MYKGTFQKYYKTWHYDQQEVWATIRTFLTNKGMMTSNEISLKQ